MKWPLPGEEHHIAFKELFAVLLACAIWGSKWQGFRVRCLCDNQAAVHAIAGRSCRDRSLMHLLHCLFYLEAWFQFDLLAAHIPGPANTLADDLSCDRCSSFLSKAPMGMEANPTLVPQQLPALLWERSNWTSPSWTRRFISCVTEA